MESGLWLHSLISPGLESVRWRRLINLSTEKNTGKKDTGADSQATSQADSRSFGDVSVRQCYNMPRVLGFISYVC